MGINQVKNLLSQKENIRLEFKKALKELPENIFETVCAMLNRDGGEIILGVSDDGLILGVDSGNVDKIVAQIVAQSNNPQKLDPPFILFPQKYELEGKLIIRLQVPVSSQVHKTANTVYDRSNDGGFRILNPVNIADMVNRKRLYFSEINTFSAVCYSDLKEELFLKVRNLIRSNNPNHPWLSLTNEQMLSRAGILRRDPQTGIESYTLAAVLLFGKDEVIQNILPFFKIDAIVRKKDLTRYDDRDYIQCNLIEAYDRLMNFISKHLPDKFYLEEDRRVSLLNKVFREVVANFLVHREYTNASPATLIIYSDRVETSNASNPHGKGIIDPVNFTPFQKNPLIAKFFIQLGRVDELGSGIINVNRYLPHYSGTKTRPQFIEGDVFKTVIPIGRRYATEGINEGINEGLETLLRYISNNEGLRANQLSTALNTPKKTIERWIYNLKSKNKIEFKGSKKTGGYYLKGSKYKP